MTVVIGMVAEGTHDYLMLEPAIRVELEQRLNDTVQFRHLQPMPDATGTYSDGGYSQVVTWCSRFAGVGIETFYKPLFAGDRPCDFVVVHMDGDALEDVRSHTSVVFPDPVPPDKRVSIGVRVIEAWLNLSPERRSTLAIAVPVLHSEAWILGAEGVANCEAIDAKALLRSTHSRQAHGTMAVFYGTRAKAAAPAIAAMQLSPSYLAFKAELSVLTL